MAAYNELPVFKASYDLLLYLYRFTGTLSREYKFSLGEKIKVETTDLLMNIYRANRVFDKNEYLVNARENLEADRLYIRILHDLKQIGMKKYVTINQMMEGVSRQLAGWQKSIQ